MRWRDRWSVALWSFAIFMNASFALALWGAFDLRAAIVDFILTLVLTLLIAQRTPLVIRVEGDWLYVGKAKIEKKFISTVELLNKDEMSKLRTTDANPNAYLNLRFWVAEGIKIEISDARDYTPYWLVSTKSGSAIKKALLEN